MVRSLLVHSPAGHYAMDGGGYFFVSMTCPSATILCQGLTDSDEYYNLWAAFMEPDSPPGSPSRPSDDEPSGAAADGSVKEDERNDGQNDDTVEDREFPWCFRPCITAASSVPV